MEVRPEPHPKDADGSVNTAEGRITTPPSTEPQTFAFVKIDLGSCYPLVFANRLLHSLYIQATGYKDCDIISERGNPSCKRASKRDTSQGRINLLIPRHTEQELQSEDIEQQTGGIPVGSNARSRTPSIRLLEGCSTLCKSICRTPVRIQQSLK